MSGCDDCVHFAKSRIEEPCDRCYKSDWAREHFSCLFDNFQQRKPTRYDRLLAEMTPEKMAEKRIETDLCVNNGLADIFWLTDAGRFSEYADAIAAEIAWLKGADA